MGLPPSRVSRTANSRLRSCSRRASRYRYFARSLPGRSRQPSSKAARAAVTARSTSSSPASATTASCSSVAGLIVGKEAPERASTHSPPTQRPYSSRRSTIAVDSWEVAYSSVNSAGWVRSVMRSVDGEVVGSLVAAGRQPPALHEEVVQQARGTQAEALRSQPPRAERLAHDD